jgi:hypothetical protein
MDDHKDSGVRQGQRPYRAVHKLSRARCHAGSSIWHLTASCSAWPTLVYAAEDRIPDGATICPECIGYTQASEAA